MAVSVPDLIPAEQEVRQGSGKREEKSGFFPSCTLLLPGLPAFVASLISQVR